MKIKILLGLTAMFAFASIAFAQTIVIQPKKTTYTRKGKISSEEKRIFVVTYPLFNGTMSTAAKKKLANTISYWRVFETTLAENLSEYEWLSEMSYIVKYNKNGILDIALSQEGSAAYPDQSTKELVIDLKTGEQVKFSDAFKTESLDTFAKMVNKKLEVEKQAIVKSIDKGAFGEENDKEANDSLKEQVGGLSFTAENFNEYSISDKGITILYDAEFPHVIQALQPDGQYFFSWTELKSFIKPDGLLGKFIR